MIKIFEKKKYSTGKREIFFCGKKVFTYIKKNICSPIDYYRSLGVKIGDNSYFVVYPHKNSHPNFGSEPYLIEIGNNVWVSFGVTFLTHDGSILACKPYFKNDKHIIKLGKIIIKDGAFIGCNSTLLPNVTIGENSIVGAGSVVTKSIPDGEVWAGNPARFITTTEKLAQKIEEKSDSDEQKNLLEIVEMNRKK